MYKVEYNVFIKIVLIMLSLFVISSSLLNPLNTYNVYAAEKKEDAKSTESKKAYETNESTKDSPDGETTKEMTSGSAFDNTNNVLSTDTVGTDSGAMKMLDSALSYDESLQLEMTKKMLISKALSSSSGGYSSIYSTGKYATSNLQQDILNNKAELDTKLKETKVVPFKDLKDKEKTKAIALFKGTSYAGNEKKIASVYDEIMSTIHGESSGVSSMDKLRNQFMVESSKTLADTLCETSYNPSTYGGLVKADLVKVNKVVLKEKSKIYIHTGVENIDNSSHLSSNVNGGVISKGTLNEGVSKCKSKLEPMLNNKMFKSGSGDIVGLPALTTIIDGMVDKAGGDFSSKNTSLRTSFYSMIENINESDANSLRQYYDGSYSSLQMYTTTLGENAEISGKVNMIENKVLTTKTEGFNLYSIEGRGRGADISAINKKDISKMISQYNTIYSDKVSTDVDKALENSNFQAYVSVLNGLTVTRLDANITSKEANDKFQAYYNKLKDSKYAIVKGNEDYFGISASGVKNTDVRGLGWVPMYYTGAGVDESLDDLMDSFDGGVPQDDGIYVDSNKRPVQVHDFVPVKKTKFYSPYLASSNQVSAGHLGKTFSKLNQHSALVSKDGKVDKIDDIKSSKVKYTLSKGLFTNSGGGGGSGGIGIDNYGNMVVGTSLAPVIPYWQNEEVVSKADFASHPFLKDADKKVLDAIKGTYSDGMSSDKVAESIKANKNITEIAEKIVGLTKDDVKKYNSEFIQGYHADKAAGKGELYLSTAKLATDTEDADKMDNLAEEFTDADLKKKIGLMLKYGAGPFIRLTFVSLFVDFYNTVVYNFTISQVFYTSTLTDTQFFKDLIPTIVGLLVVASIVYVVTSTIRMRRGTLDWGRFLITLTALTFAILMPFVYKYVIDKAINEPTDLILGRQTRQMFVLDAQLYDVKETLGLDGDEMSDNADTGSDETSSDTTDDSSKEDSSSDDIAASSSGNKVEKGAKGYCAILPAGADAGSEEVGETKIMSTKALSPQALNLARKVAKTFPEVKQIGGFRPCDGTAPDHPSGLALDIMVNSNGKPNSALGTKINNWLHKNKESTGIDSTIWEDKWKSAVTSSEKYPLVGAGGNITTRHFDHVHVKMKTDGKVDSSGSPSEESSDSSTVAGEVSEEKELIRFLGGGTGLTFRDMSQDYTLEFYTTTTTDGCVIDSPDSDFCKNRIGTDNWATKKWDKSDLVSVKVSVFDVFKWLDTMEAEKDEAADEALLKESTEKAKASKNTKTKENTKEVAPIAESDLPQTGTQQTLFEFLSTLEDAEKKGYSELAEYKEYSFDKSVILTAIGENQGARNYESVKEDGENTITASGLLAKIYGGAVADDLNSNMQILTTIYEKYENGEMSNDERSAIVRDISMTKEARQYYYGSEKELSAKSTLALTGGDESGASYEVSIPENGSGDFLNLRSSLEGINPYRTPFTNSLNDDIFYVNKNTIDMYLNEIAMVKKISEQSGSSTLQSVEKKVIVLNAWFKSNEVLDLNLYPRAFKGNTVSLDNYMRVAYVPIGEFASVVQDPEKKNNYSNVGIYLSLRDNIAVLFVFGLSLIVMVLYGMIKAAVLGYILLGLTIYAFFKNYVINVNRDNKMWFGSFVLYGTFIVTNALFNAMWWTFGYFINKSYVNNANMVGYNSTLIHSGIVIAVLSFVIFYVFWKLFDKVRKDVGNMGGQEFSDSFDKFKSKIKAVTKGGKANLRIGESYSQDKTKEGSKGAITDADLMSKELQDDIDSRLVNADGNGIDGIMSHLKDEKDAKDNPDSLYANMKSIINPKSVKGKQIKNIAEDYDKIEATEFNAEEFEGYGLEGATLGKTGDGQNVYSLGFGAGEAGARQAKKFAEYLEKKGIKNIADDKGNVAFDAGMHDLSTPGGRKALFDGFIKDSVENARNKDMLKMDTVNNSAMNNNLRYNVDKDGNFNIEVSEENGLHPDVLADMMKSKDFKNNFKVVKGYNGKGKPGSITLKSKKYGNDEKGNPYTLEDRELDVFKLFKQDSSHRSAKKLDARQESDGTALMQFDENNPMFNKILDEELYKVRRGSNAKEYEGMAKHSNKLVFDDKNEKHLALVEKVRNRFMEESVSDTRDAQDIAAKVGSFVVNGKGSKASDKQKQLLREEVNSYSDEDNQVLYNVADTENYTTTTEGRKYKMSVNVDTENLINRSRDVIGKVKGYTKEQMKQLFDVDNEHFIDMDEKLVEFSAPTVGEQYALYNEVNTSTEEASGSGVKFRHINPNNPRENEFINNAGFREVQSIKTYRGNDFINKVNNSKVELEIIKENEKTIDDFFEIKTQAVNYAEKGLAEDNNYSKVDKMVRTVKDFAPLRDIYDEYRTQLLKREELANKNGTSVHDDPVFENIFAEMKAEIENSNYHESFMAELGRKHYVDSKDNYIFNGKYELAEENVDNLNFKHIMSDNIANMDASKYANLMDMANENIKVEANDDGTVNIISKQELDLDNTEVLDIIDNLFD